MYIGRRKMLVIFLCLLDLSNTGSCKPSTSFDTVIFDYYPLQSLRPLGCHVQSLWTWTLIPGSSIQVFIVRLSTLKGIDQAKINDA